MGGAGGGGAGWGACGCLEALLSRSTGLTSFLLTYSSAQGTANSCVKAGARCACSGVSCGQALQRALARQCAIDASVRPQSLAEGCRAQPAPKLALRCLPAQQRASSRSRK